MDLDQSRELRIGGAERVVRACLPGLTGFAPSSHGHLVCVLWVGR